MRFAGKVQTSADMSLGGDDALGQAVVQSVQNVSLCIHYSVVEVCLDLAQDGFADLVGYVQLLGLGDPVFLRLRSHSVM